MAGVLSISHDDSANWQTVRFRFANLPRKTKGPASMELRGGERDWEQEKITENEQNKKWQRNESGA